jgi:prepilin-type N-terminal cleavage/methylation domain-containing protein
MGLYARSRFRAFTLAELLVVLGIIGLLMSLMLPALAAAREKARSVSCAARLNELGKAMAAYAGNTGYLLPHDGTESLLEPRWTEVLLGEEYGHDEYGTARTDILLCPSDPFDGNPPGGGLNLRNSYLLNSWIINSTDLRKMGRKPDFVVPSETVVLGEKRPEAFGLYLFYASVPGKMNPSERDLVDLFRHGTRLRSNHLFLDLHVSNVELPGAAKQNPWVPLPR